MSLKPSPGWAVVKRVEAESATKSGIVIANLQTNDPSRGQVVAINPVSNGIKENNKVVIRHGTGQGIKVDGVEYVLVEISNIIAKIE